MTLPRSRRGRSSGSKESRSVVLCGKTVAGAAEICTVLYGTTRRKLHFHTQERVVGLKFLAFPLTHTNQSRTVNDTVLTVRDFISDRYFSVFKGSNVIRKFFRVLFSTDNFEIHYALARCSLSSAWRAKANKILAIVRGSSRPIHAECNRDESFRASCVTRGSLGSGMQRAKEKEHYRQGAPSRAGRERRHRIAPCP
jgi:hypothetical protein